ncbi:MAG: YdbH domain-containing protein [Neptuniibacter sp.]
MQVRTKLLLWLLPPLLLLSSTAGLYFLSPQIAQYAFNNWLQKQNFSQVKLSMHPPGWNELRIERISLVKQEQNKEIHIDLRNLILRFNPVEMFLQQRLKELLINESSVNIHYKEIVESDTPTQEIDLSNVLPSQWFKHVPVDLLRIGELKLKLDYPEDIPDWQFTGAIHFTPHQLTSRIHFQRAQQDLGWADLETRTDDHFNLRLLLEDQPVLVIDGQLYYENALKLKSSQLIELGGFLNWQQKVLNLETHLPAITGSLTAKGVTAFPLKTRFTPDALLLSVESQQTIETNFKLKQPSPQIAELTAAIMGQLQFSTNFLNLSLSDKTRFTAKRVKLEAAQKPLSHVIIELQKNLSVKTDLSSAMRNEPMTPIITESLFKLSIPEILLAQGKLDPTVTLLRINPIQNLQEMSGSLSTNNLNFHLPEQRLPSLNLNLDFILKGSQLQSQYTLATTELPVSLSGNLTSNFERSNSEVNWKLEPIALKNIDRTLTPYLTIPPEISISQGTLFHNGSAKFNNGKLSATTFNSIRSAEARWEDYLLDSIDWDSRTILTTAGKIRDKGSVKLKRAKTGVDITEIETGYSFTYSSDGQLLSLKEISAKLLEGEVRIEPFTLDPAEPDFSTSVTVQQIDLGEVLSLEQQQGLSGEGKLSGSFPLRFSQGELTIEDGGLFSLQPGGKIIFAPNPTVLAYAATNVGLKIALEALENFHFDTLDIKLNYSKDGTAHLNTRLKGNNPDWNDGHPVDFTINIEENIPKLLQALQFTEKLTKSIEKRYR